MESVEVNYYDYRDEIPPKELDETIEKRDLQLPVLFIGGKPVFQGALPTIEDLLEAVQGRA